MHEAAAMNEVTVNGIRLSVESSGRPGGPALVFANSLGTDMRIWERVLPLLPVGLRVIRYDERGQGGSEVPPAPYSIADHAADLAGLLATLDIDSAVIVGLSIGGLIAQELWAKEPQRIRGLVLMDTACKIATAEFWNNRIAAVKAGGLDSVADAVLERWFSLTFRTAQAADLAHWRDMLVSSPAEGYVGSCAAIRDADTEEAARSIAVPTLVMCGSEDLATPPDTVKAMADLIAGARFTMIDGAGHLPCIEAPSLVALQIGALLKEHGFV
jgi:3-oxoadipate enol-lactonase